MTFLPKKPQDRQLGETLRASGQKNAEERLLEIIDRAITKYRADTLAGCRYMLREIENEEDFYIVWEFFVGVRMQVARARWMQRREELAAKARMQRAEEAKARQQPQNYGRPNASGGGQKSNARVEGQSLAAVPARAAANETPNASGGGQSAHAPVESQAAPVRTDADSEDKFGKWAAERDAKREAAYQANLARVAERQKARNESLEWLNGVVSRSLLDTIIFDGVPLGDWYPERLAPVVHQRMAHCGLAKRVIAVASPGRPIRESKIPEDDLQKMMVDAEAETSV